MNDYEERMLWELLCKIHYTVVTHPNDAYSASGLRVVIEKMMKIMIGQPDDNKPILVLLTNGDYNKDEV